jgi:alginate O-acetyltransferase complex protein AlgI
LGIFCYTFQIYFDFSGYSDMAIGLATMLGFRFQENFNRPYLSQNFTEFWRRWHISLSDWFKEYLYIPMGGNRVSRARKYLNLWTVFLVSGLWHGANWTFIVWGAYHGFFLLADKLFLTAILQKFGRSFNIALTFLLVTIGWVIFRSENIGAGIQYLEKLFGFFPQSETLIPILMTDLVTNRGLVVIFLAALLSFIPEKIVCFVRDLLISKVSGVQMYRLKIAGLFLLSALAFSALVNNSFRPFIYFRF